MSLQLNRDNVKSVIRNIAVSRRINLIPQQVDCVVDYFMKSPPYTWASFLEANKIDPMNQVNFLTKILLNGPCSNSNTCNNAIQTPKGELPPTLVGISGTGLMGLGFGGVGYEQRTPRDAAAIASYNATSPSYYKNAFPDPSARPVVEQFTQDPLRAPCQIMSYRTPQDKIDLMTYDNLAQNAYNSAYPSPTSRPTWESFIQRRR
jgi:hypothetical protein